MPKTPRTDDTADIMAGPDNDSTALLPAQQPVEPASAPNASSGAPSELDRTPFDAALDELDGLASELQDLEGQAPTGESQWPVGFCLSIIVPVYNEAETVEQILNRLLDLDVPTQVIVVDDGSTDGTQEVLSGWLGREGVDVVLKSQNEGKGAAIRTGFAHVDGDLVVIQDADLEYDPSDIPSLLGPILAGEADVVYGSRFLEERWAGSSWVHRLGNRLLTEFSNLTTGLQLTDMETCYKVFPAALLNEIEIRQDRFGFEPELTAKLARRELEFKELPVHYHARDWSDGKKIGFSDALNAIYCMLRYACFD